MKANKTISQNVALLHNHHYSQLISFLNLPSASVISLFENDSHQLKLKSLNKFLPPQKIFVKTLKVIHPHNPEVAGLKIAKAVNFFKTFVSLCVTKPIPFDFLSSVGFK